MINAITSNQQISFTGKTYSKKAMRECEEFCEDFCKNIKKGKKKFKKPSSANYRAYTTGIVNTNNLERCPFGYKARNSKELIPYTGSLDKAVGFSTEAGGYGGGWLKADTNTPLSTKDVHNCALLNLVNENTNEQMLYHVYGFTQANTVKDFVADKFPRFTKVNIMPGDQFQTNSTVNNIVEAINEINPKAPKQYYHMPVENPEVISVNGELQFLPNSNPKDMTFQQITNQYIY